MSDLADIPHCLRAVRGALNSVRTYSKANSDLSLSHHFLYALPIDPIASQASYDFLVLGVNPGETDDSWDIINEPGQEESFEHDFHEVANRTTRGRENWRKKIRSTLPQGATILSELFFWSSKNIAELNKRFPTWRDGQHIAFCTAKNIELIESVRPQAVIFSGFSEIKLVRNLFGLRQQKVERCCACDLKIAELHDDGTRKWFFVPHLSGSKGVTNRQRKLASDFISRELNL